MFELVRDYIDNTIIGKKKIPYLDVLVKKDGNVIFRHYNNLKGNATGKEKLFLFSCSKIITSVVVLRLVDKGLISLDDEVSKYIPEFKNAYILNEGVKIKPNTNTTIRHLLSMQSGIPYKFTSIYIKELFNNRPNATAYDLANEIIKSPILFNPGENHIYGLSYDVLGGVIEKATGKRLKDHVEEDIFKPLEMKNSTFGYTDAVDFEPLYTVPNDKIVPFDLNQLEKWANYPTLDGAGGGLKSTVEDFSIFVDALTNNGIAKNGFVLLNQKMLNLIKTETTELIKQKENYFTCIQGTDDYGYTMGLRIRKTNTPWGLKSLHEFGWDGAAGSYCLIDDLNNISVTIGMHVRNWPTVFTGEHLNIVKLIYEELGIKNNT